MKGAFPTGTDPSGKPVAFVPPKIEELTAKFPQLEILEFIGQGGMGAVYKARQKQLDRVVALKILPPQAASGPGFAERFAREARAMAKLNHPHIVTLYEFGQADGLFYFLMEFVDGTNLRRVLNAGRIAPKEALAIVPQICEALQFAHENGIVHRDIKPENILLSKSGQVKIADFGVAKIVAEGLTEAAGTVVAPSGELTEAGSTLGTPQYMAPEQIKNSAEVDHRADIYSLGVVFYQMLTGELPEGKIEPPSKKVHIDVRLDEVVLRALEKKPELRFQDANVLKTQVETIAQTPGEAAAAAFIQAAQGRDYSLNITSCLERGWRLLISDFWPIVGISALVWLLARIASSSVIGIVIGGPLSGGFWLYYLNRIRGRTATLETAFSGFKVAFLQLVLVGVITGVLKFLGFLFLIIPGIYLLVVWMFAVPLVADRGLEFWPAMGLSYKVISRHWWKFFGFVVVLAVIHIVGVACCYVGLFIAMPVCMAAMAYAYEDIFGPVAGASGAAPAGSPVARSSGSGLGMAAGLGLGAAAVVFGFAVILVFANRIHTGHGAVDMERMQREQRARETQAQRANGRSDYIGKASFPRGDSITIISVERWPDRMVAKGRYRLASADSALLALEITSTNDGGAVPLDAVQQKEIFKGRGDFTLSNYHPIPGLPHVSMYPTDSTNGAFAELYFGTQAEALAESKMGGGDVGTNSIPLAGNIANLESGTNGSSRLLYQWYNDTSRVPGWYNDTGKVPGATNEQRGLNLQNSNSEPQ
jgi:predicted Ser/Thr protein kinase